MIKAPLHTGEPRGAEIRDRCVALPSTQSAWWLTVLVWFTGVDVVPSGMCFHDSRVSISPSPVARESDVRVS